MIWLASTACAPRVRASPDPPHADDPGRLAESLQIAGGALVGASIGAAWLLRDRAAHPAPERFGAGTRALLLLGGTAVGAGLGALAARLRPPSVGRALFTPTATLLLATGAGLLAAGLAPAERRGEHGYLSAALALELGVLVAAPAGRAISPRPRRSLGMALGALVGAGLGVLAGAPLGRSLDGQGTRAGLLGAGAGLLLGGAVGLITTRP